ncbi:hypothetical protein [Herbiconiux liukaitaii]|uniref:hypothetical protein n=1 Tax=Herbiconiux liukaitaii TaxID=3342799 RepID=UPI0035B7D040
MATLRATMTKNGTTEEFQVEAADFESAKHRLPFSEGWVVTSYFYDARAESSLEAAA